MRRWRLAANSAKARISTSTQTWNVGRKGGTASSAARTAATHRGGTRTVPAVTIAPPAVRCWTSGRPSNPHGRTIRKTRSEERRVGKEWRGGWWREREQQTHI